VTTRTNLNIIVIDDDVGVAKALGRLLRAYGHIVQTSYDAREGFELASRIKPDLILHDIAMRSLDGYEAARRLRELPSLSGTTLIACSGAVDEKLARAAGFDGWLVKPISKGDLDAVLAIVLKRVNQSAANSESNSGSG
jgi:CheY-like chemotaxis protein